MNIMPAVSPMHPTMHLPTNDVNVNRKLLPEFSFTGGGTAPDSLMTVRPRFPTFIASPFISRICRGVRASGITIHAMR